MTNYVTTSTPVFENFFMVDLIDVVKKEIEQIVVDQDAENILLRGVI